MNCILIKRDKDIIATIPGDERTVFSETPVGRISGLFYHCYYVPMQIWDCIVFAGVNYYLNSYPEIMKISRDNYIYQLDLLTHQTNRRGAFTH